MGIVKSAEAPIGLSAFSMKDIEAAARGVLLRARTEAATIIATARTEAVQIKEQAHANGMAEGRQQGLAQGREEGNKSGHTQALTENGQEMKRLIESMTQAAIKLDEDRDDLHTAGLREVVDLACGIARRVTRRQAILDPQTLCENLKQAMSLAIHAADVRIALHPSQMQTLQKEMPNLRLAWPQLKHFELTEDASITPGGIRIFTAHGQIDGQLETQLDRIAAELMPQAAENLPAQASATGEAVSS